MQNASELAATIVCAALENVLTYSLPLVAFALAQERTVRSRAAWALSVLALATFLEARSPGFLHELVRAAVGFACYLPAAALAYHVRPMVADSRLSKPALFCLLLTSFVVIPAALLRFLQAVPLLVAGWLMVLAAYSYCVDARPSREALSFRSCLFFLFVDPSLVFPERGVKHLRHEGARSGAARTIAGVTSMALGLAVLGFLPKATGTVLDATPGGAWYLNGLLTGSLVLVATFLTRAGFAGARIGLLRVLGYDVRECYLRPYLASSPRDFWQRWNRYVGTWARRYLFGPLVLQFTRALRRRSPTLPMWIAQGASILLTFSFIGLLHDAPTALLNGRFEHRHAVAFVAAAGLLLAWEGVARLGWRLASTMTTRLGRCWGLLARLGTLQYVLAIVLILRSLH